eukprot:5355879-Pleurochrysis_carterae.AAC.2
MLGSQWRKERRALQGIARTCGVREAGAAAASRGARSRGCTCRWRRRTACDPPPQATYTCGRVCVHAQRLNERAGPPSTNRMTTDLSRRRAAASAAVDGHAPERGWFGCCTVSKMRSTQVRVPQRS